MNEAITIQVRDFAGGAIAVSGEDGQRLYDAIVPLLKEGKPVVLSFAGIETMIAAFLGAAVGQLYGEFPAERIGGLLSIRDLSPDDELQLGRVVRNAKGYFENPESYDQAWKEVVGNEIEK
jgi:hypothetical protein